MLEDRRPNPLRYAYVSVKADHEHDHAQHNTTALVEQADLTQMPARSLYVCVGVGCMSCRLRAGCTW